MFLRLWAYSILSPSINGLVLYLCCALKSYVLQPLYRALLPEVDQRRGPALLKLFADWLLLRPNKSS